MANCVKCENGGRKYYDNNTGTELYYCSIDQLLYSRYEPCPHKFTFKKEWHPELYVIWKTENESQTGKSRHYRIYTKTQILYGSAGGKSQDVAIPYSQHKIVTIDNKDYIQLTSWYYEQKKLSFDLLLSRNDQLDLERKARKTVALDSFFGGRK